MRSVLRRIFVAALCLMLVMQAAFAYTTLEKGDSGSDVLKMQQALTKIGYTVECDGKYGTDTVNTVKLFQKDYDLQVDGKAGDETLTLLYYLAENSASAPDTQDKEEAPADSSLQATVYCADGGKLNLRKRASTSATVLEQIPTGEVLTIYEKGSKWCYTNYGGEWGYVMTSFLRFDETAAPDTGDKEEDNDSSALKATVYCADGGKLNLRKTASSSASVITRIPNGTSLTLLEKGSRWCKVTYKDKTGYVMTSFLIFDTVVTPPVEDDKEEVTPPEEDSATLKATVYCADGGKLNLRKKASASASVLKQIPTGTVLPIYEKGGTWCKTSYAGKDGYVMTKYLRFDSTGTTTPDTKPEETPDDDNEPVGMAQVTCDNGGKLNLRAGRGTGYKTLYQIPNLSYVTVHENHGTWCEVSIGKYTGYVMTKYLTFVETEAPEEDDKDEEAPPVVTPPSSDDTTATDAMRFGEYRYATVKTESGGTLNLRKAESTDSGKVTEIPNGSRVVVRAINGEWCDVYYGDKVGYVMTKYLVIEAGKGDYVDTSTKYDTSILDRTLKDGYTGADVELVQARLVELKYLSSASGKYDSATQTAVTRFQKQHGLDVDGLAGEKTFGMLFSSEAFEYTADTSAYSRYVIRYNSSSGTGDDKRVAAITKAQKRLRELNYLCPINGDFAELTHDAIVDFQLRNGLAANGVLDAATQLRLYADDARDAAFPARYYLEENAGLNEVAPTDIKLIHWTEAKKQINADSVLTVYHPETGLSFKLNHLSEGRHWDVEPDSLRDTLIMRKAFNGMSWDIQVVYVLLPDGTWTMATMHNRAHGDITIHDNGFGGQNCVHFLRDMDEAQKNDPSYGVNNQEVLRDAWLKLTGETITK